MHKVAAHDVEKNSYTKQGKRQAHEAGQLQRQRREAGHHIHRVRDQLANRVARGTLFARVVAHSRCGKPACAPREQYINRHEGPCVVVKRGGHVGSKGAKRTDLPRDIRPHDRLECQLGYEGGDVASKTMLLLLGRAVNDVTSLLENREQLRNLFRRMLQVVIHGDDDAVLGRPNSSQQSIVLAVIAHEVDGAYPCELALELADDGPTFVGAGVIYQNEFVLPGDRRKRLREPLHKFRQDGFASVNRHHDRNAGPSRHISWSSCHLSGSIYPCSTARVSPSPFMVST